VRTMSPKISRSEADGNADGSTGAKRRTPLDCMRGIRSRTAGHGPRRTALSRTGNAVGGQPSRGFESHPLRQCRVSGHPGRLLQDIVDRPAAVENPSGNHLVSHFGWMDYPLGSCHGPREPGGLGAVESGER